MENDNLDKPIVESKRSFPKIIFVIIALVLIAEAIFAVRTLTQPTPAPLLGIEKASTTAKVGLVSMQNTYKIGDSIPVEIQVDTGGHKISGADVVLHFDPTILKADSTSIVKGTTLKDYPFLGVDQKAGTVTVSGISSLADSYSGKFSLATVNFKAIAVGTTALTIIFEQGSTTDTNLVGSGTNKDILEKVENLNLTVK